MTEMPRIGDAYYQITLPEGPDKPFRIDTWIYKGFLKDEFRNRFYHYFECFSRTLKIRTADQMMLTMFNPKELLHELSMLVTSLEKDG